MASHLRNGVWNALLVMSQLLVLAPQIAHGKASFGATRGFSENELLVFHDNPQSGTGINVANIKITARNTEGAEEEIVPLSPLSSNYFSCSMGLDPIMFKLCQFTVPAEYADKFADYYKDTIIVYISDDFDPGEIAIPLVDRNLKEATGDNNEGMNAIVSASHNFADGQFTFGTDDNSAWLSGIGVTLIPETVKLYYDSDQEVEGVRIQIDFSDGAPAATFGNMDGVTDAILVGQFASNDITSIQVRYNAEYTMCGLKLEGASDSLEAGCASGTQTDVTYTIDAGWGFTGFYEISGTVGEGDPMRLLLPFQYQLLQPQLVFYEMANDRSLVAIWNNFWDVPSANVELTIQDSRDNEGALQTSTYTQVLTAATDGPYFMFDIQNLAGVPSGSLACTPFTLTFAIDDQTDRVYVDDPTPVLDSWTQRYTSVGSVTSIQSPKQDDLGTTVYSSARNRYKSGFSDCLTFPKMIRGDVGLLDGIFYFDADDIVPVGPVVEGAQPEMTPLPSNFDKIDVYFDSNGDLVAMNFENVETSATTTIGDPGSNTAQTVEAPVKGAVLHRMEATFNADQTQTRILTFSWLVESAPWNIYHKAVMKKPTSIESPFDTVGERSDLLEVKFWSPNRAQGFGLKLTKESTGAETEVTFGREETQPFGRGLDFTRSLYNLDAESSYDFVLYGFHTTTGEALTESEVVSFSTSTGVQQQCDANGDMFTLVDYEAVPQNGVMYADAPVVSFGPAPSPAVTVSADDIQNPYTNENEYFQYSHSVAADFYGYPTTMALYYETGGTFFTGLSLTYSDGEGGDIVKFLAGAQTDNAVTASLAPEQFHLAGFDYSADTEGRLTGIKFLNEQDQVLGGGCLDIADAEDCSTTGSRQSDLGGISNQGLYRVYSFKVTIAQDSTANPGIYGIQFQYVYVEPPKLITATPDACNAGPQIDYRYFHSTHWINSVNVQDTQTCSVSSTVYPDPSSSPINKHAVAYGRTFQKEGETGSGEVVTGSGVSVIRQSGWQINTNCYYEANATLDSYFNTKGEAGQRVASLNELDFQMQIAHSSDYSTFYGSDQIPSVGLNQKLYVQVSLGEDLDGFNTVVAIECYATQNDDAEDTDRYVIENLTCDADPSFERPAAPTTVDRFHFTTFAWFEETVQTSMVYFHCVVRACPDSDLTQCTLPDGCVGARNAARRRREAVPYMGEWQEFKRQTRGVQMQERVISQPLLLRQNRDTEMLHIERDVVKPFYQQPLVLLTTAFSLFALVSFLVVGAKARNWFKRSSRYDLLTNESMSHAA